MMPVTLVKKEEQFYSDPKHEDLWTKVLNEDAKGSEGMPIALQLVGYSFEDEKLLGLMESISHEIGFSLPRPADLAKK